MITTIMSSVESTGIIEENGIYYIKNKETGLYMQSIDLNFIDGSDVMQMPYQNGVNHTKNRFQFVDTGDGIIHFI